MSNCKALLPLLLLPLLGGCIGADPLLTRAPSDPPAVAEIASLRDTGLHYTNHRRATFTTRSAAPEIVRIAIDQRFDPSDRAKIQRAVSEWNQVLNGFARLQVAAVIDDGRPAEDQAPIWKVVPAHDDNAKSDVGALFSRALAVTYPLRRVGGMVIVYVDRLGKRDLTDVMRHELGHVLGLDHELDGRLMSSKYTAYNQECIDQAAVEAIAANRMLPEAQLNWCEASTVGSGNKSDM